MIRWSAPCYPRMDDRTQTVHDAVMWTTLVPGECYAADSERFGESAVVPVHGTADCVDGEGRSLAVGDVVYRPGGVAHTVRNAGSADAHLLIVRAPTAAPRLGGRERGSPGPNAARVVRRRNVRACRLESVMGFRGVESTLALTAATVCARDLLVGFARFEPDGAHALHRHLAAAEVLYILEGEGCQHMGEEGRVALAKDDLTYVAAGEWHGFRNTGDHPAEVVFAYLGAASIETDGYELYGR